MSVIVISGVQRHPGHAKCVMETFGGGKNKEVGGRGQNLKCVDVYV